MNERIVTCVVCGARAGAGSSFKRGRCSQCQAELVRRKGTRTAVWHAIVLIGGAYVAASGTSEPLGVVPFIVLSLAVFDVVFIVVTVVHEAAHALVSLMFGFGVREVSIGVGPTIATTRVGGTRLVVKLYPVGGHTLTLPRGKNLRTKMFAVSAVGPLSHIPLAAWLATVSLESELWDILLGPTPELVMFYMLVNLVPVFDNDGRNLVRLFTMSDDQIRTVDAAVSSLTDLSAAIADPGSNPLNRSQREPILTYLQTPSLTPAQRAEGLNNLAVIDVLLEDPELLAEADEASAEAYELMPDNPAIQNTRASVLILNGDYTGGIKLMRPTMTRIQKQALAESHLDLAYAHVKLGHAFEGRDHLHAVAGRHARPRLYAETLRELGALESVVIRGFGEDGEDPSDTAARFRSQAGPQAVITGEAIKAHNTATGQDTDLGEIARALAPEPQS